MKKYYIALFLIFFIGKNYVASQINSHNDSVINALQGRTGPEIITIYPLVGDKELIKTNYSVIYPILILNGIQIREITLLNCFRNYFDKTKIKKIKHITKEQAAKKGILNVPKDGVLFVTTKKGYYFDFLCE
ncbi:MAG: hypothetical protein QM751_03490 [Paludibacteraceae bacterium]